MNMNLTSTSSSISTGKGFGFWGNLRLSRKLLWAFGALFVLTSILAVITLWGFNRVTRVYEETLSQGVEVRRLSAKLNGDLLQARREEKNFLLRWKSEGYDTAYTNYILLNQESVTAMRDDIQQLSSFGSVAETVSTGDMTQAQYEADIASVAQYTDTYEQSFTNLVSALKQRGGNENTGLELSMRDAARGMEDMVSGKAGLENLEISLLQMRRHEKDYLARSGQEYIDNVHGTAAELRTQIASSEILGAAQKTELTALITEYLKNFDAIVVIDNEITTLNEAMLAAARAVEPVAAKLGALGVQLAADGINTAHADSTQTYTLSIVTMIIVLGVSIFLAIFLAQQLTRPVSELTRVAQEIAAGNFDAQAGVTSGDEIGTLAQTFNTMTARLREAFEDVRKRAAELATVAEVGTATATILDTDRLLLEVVELSKERFNLYHSHIYLLDEAGENLVLAMGAGEPGRQMKARGLSIPLNREQSLVARAAREKKGVTVNDVTQAPDFLPNPLLPNTRSELATPMIVGGKVIGVFDVQSNVAGRFTDSDINIQTTLAAQVATSIQNVRSFEQSKAQADLETMVNTIGQKIQRANTVEETLQTAIREIGLSLGAARVTAKLGLSATRKASDN